MSVTRDAADKSSRGLVHCDRLDLLGGVRTDRIALIWVQDQEIDYAVARKTNTVNIY